MNKAKKQAQRVYEHCKKAIGPEVMEMQRITVASLQKQIEELRRPKMDERFIADAMIKLFDESWKNLKE